MEIDLIQHLDGFYESKEKILTKQQFMSGIEHVRNLLNEEDMDIIDFLQPEFDATKIKTESKEQ